MFENLTARLQTIFKQLSGKGRLSEADVDTALREVRLALLEADVNFRVVKDFVARVRERAIGADVADMLGLFPVLRDKQRARAATHDPLELGQAFD